MTPSSVPSALASALARDPARPLVTYSGSGGARAELSVRTFENNVAKAANLLRDDADAGPGSAVVVDLPLHWQTAVWLTACALVGAEAWLAGDATDPAVEVSVIGPEVVGAPLAPLTLATALHPLGLPATTPWPAGVLDAAAEVRTHGDVFTAYAVVPGSTPWLRAGTRRWTQAEALAEAAALAARLGLDVGDRLLLARPADPEDSDAVLALVALPLAIDGSVVLLSDLGADPAAVAVTERCAAVLG